MTEVVINGHEAVTVVIDGGRDIILSFFLFMLDCGIINQTMVYIN